MAAIYQLSVAELVFLRQNNVISKTNCDCIAPISSNLANLNTSENSANNIYVFTHSYNYYCDNFVSRMAA